jgi:hypothetical protein
MAYKYKDREITVGSSWRDDDNILHPYDWASAWSSDELKKWGVTYTPDPDISFDSKFYSAKDVEKNLNDVNVVDDDGKAVLDENGKQLVSMGLKSIWIEKTKTQAKTFLAESDWYAARKAETDKAIPSNILTYRAAVRTATTTIENKINACSDLAAFISLFQVPMDSDNRATGKAPIYDWPDIVS